ncbi:hypothetical protein [Halobacteriovorax sp.]|uniref:NADH-quinone oxidoreductase subunit D-related protein n=1 Tax=Halobacteriovorax sp. TaxID=2020862 RepID=UPI003AF20CC2
MKFINILDSIRILSKSEFALEAFRLKDNDHIVFNSLTCLDLMNSQKIKDELNLFNGRFLLIYQFQNLLEHKRYFYGISLSYGQTMSSYGHLFNALTWHEAEVNRNFGIHFYQKEDRIQEEIITPQKKYRFEKDSGSSELCNTYFKQASLRGEGVEVSLQKFLNPASKSKMIFDVDSDKVENSIFKFHFDNHISFEKNIETMTIENAINSMLGTSFSNRLMASLLLYEFDEYVNHKNKRTDLNIQRMFTFEVFSALENIKCLEKTFAKSSVAELKCIFKSQYNKIMQLFAPEGIKDLEQLKTILEMQERKWLYDIRDCIHNFEKELDNAYQVVEGNELFLKYKDYFNSNLSALDHSLKSYPLQSLGYHYNLKKFESFYEYDDLDTQEFLSLNGSTYELLIIRIKELRNTYSNIIKICEEYPVVKLKYQTPSSDSEIKPKSGLFLGVTQVSSGELGLVLNLNDDGKFDRLHYISPSVTNLEYFKRRIKKFALPQMACEWNILGLDEEEIVK